MASHFSKWVYQVFLSFRGEDTRTNFTESLYQALVHAGIHTFRDDMELQRGEDISSELLDAIEHSRVSVVIFSSKYADSRWCLDELVKILECKKNIKQKVLPVFYDISPSEVRNQTGSFTEAFVKHQLRFNMSRVEKWRAALNEVANLSGWDLHEAPKGCESKFIQQIVEEITLKLSHKFFNVAIHPVGIDSLVERVHALLKLDDSDLRKIGICGMGGIGKTTVVKAVYNMISPRFESTCFLEDVAEMAKQANGLIHLQKQMLSELLLRKTLDIDSVDRGLNVIRSRLHCRKIFLILDNIDHIDQLKALAVMNKQFGSGSRIIITTRNEHLLKAVDVDEIYMVPRLRNDKSIQLFSWHAFRKDHPTDGFMKLSKEIVGYAGGIPLALEVLGSFLFTEASTDVWRSAVEKLKKIPNKDIMKKLRISFDGLNDDEERNVFLDIACFFIGMDKDYVLTILNGCGFSSGIDVHVLTQRCLLTVDEDNRLRMHDLIRDMGREVVRQESLKYPGKRSRLWFHEDVQHVLANHSGTSAVEGLMLDLHCPEVNLMAEAFMEMRELRLLHLKHVNLHGSYEYVSKELRWLCWHGLQLKFLPPTFHLENLVALDMCYSGLTQIWKEHRVLNKLKLLNLSHCRYLTQTPNFDGLPSLKKLLLEDCPSLVEVHPSIGRLCRLVFLNLKDCKILKCLPTSMCMLKSLEILILSDCSKLDRLPDDLGNLEHLRVLLADRTPIKQLPFSVKLLKNLRILSLSGCKGASLRSTLHSFFWSWILPRSLPESVILLPTSLLGLQSLRRLDLSNCNLSDNCIPADIGNLTSLLQLDLRSNNFSQLPDTITHLSNLETLWLNDCTKLKSIPVLPTKLVYLVARNCTSLEKILGVSNSQAKLTLTLDNCRKLADIQGLDKLDTISKISMDWCNNLTNKFKKMLLQELPKRCIVGITVPGKEVPDCCSYKSLGSTICFEVPPVPNHPIKGLTVYVVYSAEEDLINTFSLGDIMIINTTKGLDWTVPVHTDLPVTHQDHMWVNHIPHATLGSQLEVGDQVKVSVNIDCSLSWIKCGIQLNYERETSSVHSEGLSLTQFTTADEKVAGYVDDNEGSSSSTCEVRPLLSKRGGYDNEAEPSTGQSRDHDPNPKRLRIE